MMKLLPSKASHYLEMFSEYDRSRKLEEGPLHRQDRLHMEVHFQEIYLVALAEVFSHLFLFQIFPFFLY